MKKLIASFLMSVFLLPCAYAQDLSFDDAVRMITEQSNDLKKADANVQKAQASLDAANASRWFHIEGTATYMNLINMKKPLDSEGVDLPPALGGIIAEITGVNQEVSIPDNIFMAGATITQPIYTFGKIGNAVDSVRSAIKMSQSGREIARREVRYGAAQLYWTAKMTDELVVITEKSLNDALSARKKLTAAGRASRANLVKIEADVAAKEIGLSDAQFNRDTAHRMLKIMAGIYVGADINLTSEFPENFAELKSEHINPPEWDMLDEQVKMYEAAALGKRAGNYPTLAATASYNYMAMHTDYEMWQGSKSQNAYWGLALSVPIFDGGLNRANATVAAMDAQVARQDLDKSKKLRSEEYNTAVHKYDHLRGNLSALNNARDLAAKAYGYSRDRFAAGQTSAVELSDVSASLFQMDAAVLNVKYNLLMAAETVKKLN